MSNNKTKVLFIGPLPPPYSGPELSTKQLLKSDLKNIFDIVFLNTNVRKDNAKKGTVDFKAFLSVITFNLKLFKLLLLQRPDIAYHLVTPTEIGWLGRDIWFLFQCKLFGVKKVIHFRGSHLEINFKTFRGISQKLIKFACKFAEAAIVQSDCLRSQFNGLVPEQKIHVIPNTVDTIFQKLDRKSISKTPKVLFFGHLTKAKGYTDIIKIIPKVSKKHPDVEFIFCGNIKRGEPGVKYNQITKERIQYEDPFDVESEIVNSEYQANYHNLGVVSGEEKLKLIKESWVLMLPSYSEGFSRSILESMASGLPIFTTPVGANKDFVKHNYNGILINPGDIDTMEKQLIRLLGDAELRKSLSENAKDTFTNEFEESKVVEKYVNLFNSLIK